MQCQGSGEISHCPFNDNILQEYIRIIPADIVSWAVEVRFPVGGKMKHILFDFDGTLFDTSNIVYNKLMEFTSVEPPSWEQLRNLSSWQVLKTLKIPVFKLRKISKHITSEISDNLGEIEIQNGITPLLSELKREKIKLHILTSNSYENVSGLLSLYELDHYFSSINNSKSLFGKSHDIRHFMKVNRVSAPELAFIGDETRDLRAANKANVKFYPVSWGYNSEAAFNNITDQFISSDTYELLNCLRLDEFVGEIDGL